MAVPKKRKSGSASENRRKPVPKARKQSKRVKKPVKKALNQGLLSLLILFFLVFALGIFAHLYLEPGETPSKSRPVVKIPVKTETPPPDPAPVTRNAPVYEEPVTEDPLIKREPLSRPPSGKPKIAIIIDDIGYDTALADNLMDLGIPLTFSILPGSPHGVEIAKKAHARGFEVMLHQPMEPESYPAVKTGPGVILMEMGADESIAVLEKNLQSVPFVRGVNNHMGSRLTQSENHMNQIFSVLKRKKIFFIDSLTSPKSQGEASARLFRLSFARRDIFLDHVQTKPFVEKQMRQLVRISEQYGSAIGIGHPHSVTLNVLQKELPSERDKVDFVYASDLAAVMAD